MELIGKNDGRNTGKIDKKDKRFVKTNNFRICKNYFIDLQKHV